MTLEDILVKCARCKGRGWRNVPCGEGPYGEPEYYYGPCPTCRGKGKVPQGKPDVVPGEWPELPHRP